MSSLCATRLMSLLASNRKSSGRYPRGGHDNRWARATIDTLLSCVGICCNNQLEGPERPFSLRSEDQLVEVELVGLHYPEGQLEDSRLERSLRCQKPDQNVFDI